MSRKIKDARMWVFVLLSFFGTFTQQLAMLSTLEKIPMIMWALALSTCLSATAGAVWAYWTDSPDTGKTLRVNPPESRKSGRAALPMLLVCGVPGLLAMALLITGCVSTKGTLDRLNSGFDATDGKVLGIVPDATVAAAADKVGLTGFRKFEQQLADMRKLYELIPAGTDLYVGLRQTSTRQLLPWDDLEIVYRMSEWSTKVSMPTPETGSRATLRILSPVPGESLQPAPAAGAVGIVTNTLPALQGPANAGIVQ